ncbi:MAG: GIY-YIG nuclease family protein [Bacteroidales bacterium]|nr:GIY-YIG nuclease family protein [Bacteroidales bacterium]MBQ7820030.1 GIY-YIG nuclease family protein [Bacteroidales bacterium]
MKNNEVYKITNKVTGKIYIGITNQGSGARYRHHWYEARIGESAPIHKSMAKYGEENFILEIIDFADTYEELKEKEKFWIKELNSMDRKIGYNLTEGGDGTFGRMHSEETKEKIRQKAIGRKISEETKKRMSEARKGRCSDVQRIHLKNIAIQTKAIPVLQFSKNGEFIARYESVSEASRQTGINSDTIERQLKKPLKNPNDWRVKFIWKKEEAVMAA